MAKMITRGGNQLAELQLYCTRAEHTGFPHNPTGFMSGRNCVALTRGKAIPCTHPAYGKQKCWTFVHMEKGRTAPRYRRHK